MASVEPLATTTTTTISAEGALLDQDKSDKLSISLNSFYLIMALVLIGILSANIAYFGSIIRFYDDMASASVVSSETFPISRQQARSIRIANGVLLAIPLVMITLSIVVIAVSAKQRQLIKMKLSKIAAVKTLSV